MPTSGRIKEAIFVSRDAVDPDVTNKPVGSMMQHSALIIASRGGYTKCKTIATLSTELVLQYHESY